MTISAPNGQPLNRPFLKWAGNKFRILDRVRSCLPAGKRLVEPFVGSGAVFLNTDYPHYLLSDSNRDLVELYSTLKTQGEEFIECCYALFRPENNREETYYRLRNEFNDTDDPVRRAALFLYLNRHGYNGLCRYNRSGGFNVPFGRYRRPYFPADEMKTFHRKAQRAVFRHEDFEKTMSRLKTGDVVYCDPPYVPLSASANFTAYSAGGFDLEAQRRLAAKARQAARSGIPVLISNHDTPETERLYTGCDIERFEVQRYISCNGEKRGKAGELLALYEPIHRNGQGV
ncbi:Dam family site-specific DNA-(adenine-N6)-methyltransferase [Thiohalomonas denitrificans]|uniref:Site-specific DNA-methyltransferase (adenine-specific) n=1 Tax=Thiohalomonas denitrificans TaxID=415747 RepID=A0A1G5PMJ6_9GAMM|nr:Dam family site-specific DNA-(adenine-N6)-methyltransferase [Thiohalomonas denitrificans]SCZ50702.1 DNA adenine methylase [Thiohalomonas denitrificans]